MANMRALCLFALLSLAYSGDTTTFFSFSRRIQTCDANDRPLEEATSKMIWSYNNQDPVDDNHIIQHDERGIKSVRFFAEDSPPNLPSDAQYTDLVLNNQNINFNMPGAGLTTQYWCSAYKLNNVFNPKRHIVRVEPVIDKRNYRNVHHILIYLCTNLNETDLAYQGGCYQGSGTPQNIKNCNSVSMVTGWAIGGYPQSFPDYLGYPLEGDNIYLLMETHYDNPQSLSITDSSGMRLWHTAQLRQYEAGTMSFSYLIESIFKIPPGQSAYPYHAYCPEECTRANIPPEGIKITAVTLHTHLAGRQVYFRQFRDGVELPPVFSEPYYDFNYQDTTWLSQERLVLPGDSFQVDCIYNTVGRVNDTQMGLSTQEEMCIAFAIYYPKFDEVEKEQCAYGNFTPFYPYAGPYNQTVSCGNLLLTDWQGPPVTEAYVPPPCVYQGPPSNNTVPKLVDKLDYSKYTSNITLDEDGNYKLYWHVDRDNLLFHAAVEVKTEGWVGLGVSPQGMDGADVLIAWVKDGEIHFGDRFAFQKAQPPLDALQDFYDITGGEYTPKPEKALSTKAIVGISVGGGLLFLAAIILLTFCIVKKKKNHDLDTVLTTDTYGGTTDMRDRDDVDPPSMNQAPATVRGEKEGVPL